MSGAKRRRDPLVRDLERTLKPLLAPAAEKAELLTDHMSRRNPSLSTAQPKGLADAARRLRKHYSDDQIRDAAVNLVDELEREYGGRDSVT